MTKGLEEIADVLRPKHLEAACKREEEESDRAQYFPVDDLEQLTRSLISAIKYVGNA